MTQSFAALDDYLTQRTADDRFSGVVLISRGERRLFGAAYGYASRSWSVPNTVDTRFDTASITKLFTSVAVLQMVEQGHLTLNTPIVDFLGLQGTSIAPEVTVYHLLTHTSGIGDDCEEEDGEVYEDLWRTKPNYSVTVTEDFLPQFVHKPANFAPGQGCRYCNCSFILLGLAVEQITGLNYRDYVRRHIFAPAGMSDSGFLRMDRAHEQVAEGADPIRDENDIVIGWKKNIYSHPPIGSPDSGANVTAADLDRFLRAVREGRLLSPSLTEAFLTPYVTYREHDDWTQMYGFGLWFFVAESGQVVCYQKEGINAGVSGMIRYFPEQGVTAVVLSNMEDGAWKPIWEIHRHVVGE